MPPLPPFRHPSSRTRTSLSTLLPFLPPQLTTTALPFLCQAPANANDHHPHLLRRIPNDAVSMHHLCPTNFPRPTSHHTVYQQQPRAMTRPRSTENASFTTCFGHPRRTQATLRQRMKWLSTKPPSLPPHHLPGPRHPHQTRSNCGTAVFPSSAKLRKPWRISLLDLPRGESSMRSGRKNLGWLVPCVAS